MARYEGRPTHGKQTAWRCKLCSALLLYIDEVEGSINIKYSDFFVWVGRPAWIRVACRKCGALNYTEDTEHPTHAKANLQV